MKKAVLFVMLCALGASATSAKPVAKAKAVPHARITAAQAAKAALAKYHGKVEGKVDLENEGGKWQYAVTVRSSKTLREVMVDANTGKIASMEVTNAKEEAKEAAGEKKAATKGAKTKTGKESEAAEKDEAGEKGEAGEKD